MHITVLRWGVLLGLGALEVAAAQDEFSFAAGTDGNGWAQAQSNADGRVMIESPEFPRGLWLDLTDEAGQPLAGLEVEWQSRPDSLVALRCFDPGGGVRKTLLWVRPAGDPIHLTLKPGEATGLPAGLTLIDWHIDPVAAALLGPARKIRFTDWEAVAAFLRGRWQDRTGRITVQLNAAAPPLTVELDYPQALEALVAHLQQAYEAARDSLGESVPLYVRIFGEGRALLEAVIFYSLLFKDSSLETAVRETLGRPQGRLTPEDIPSLDQLRASGRGIHYLAGLEPFVALQNLALTRNQIVDLTPLANLTNLTYLALWHNQLVDLTPLANLTNLNILDIHGNQIVDLTPLTNLTNLEELSLWDNQIVDLVPLANLTNLSVLELAFNQIVDLTPLANLTNSNLIHLGLIGNQIVDVTPLADLSLLSYLALTRNQIADLTPLASLTNLNTLGLSNNQIADLTPLASLTNLNTLGLSNNQIADLTPLANLTNLNTLGLSNNQIVDLTPLANLTNLSKLSLADNPLSDEARNEQIPALQTRGVEVTY